MPTLGLIHNPYQHKMGPKVYRKVYVDIIGHVTVWTCDGG